MMVMVSSTIDAANQQGSHWPRRAGVAMGYVWNADKVQVDPVYGFNEVIGKPFLGPRREAWVNVRCTYKGCGTLYEVRLANLKRGHTKSCGCMKRAQIDEVRVDPVYGFTKVIGEPYLVAGNDGKRRIWIRVECTYKQCGKLFEARLDQLKSGNTRSCGCYADDKAGQGARLRRGENHHWWRGGKSANGHGYVKILLHDHPRADTKGYVLEHIKVMSDYLGRPVEPWESVHHINGKRDDNRIENLQLRIGQHGAGQAYACQDCGSDRITPVKLKEST